MKLFVAGRQYDYGAGQEGTNMAWKDAMMVKHPGSHCGPYYTQAWLMGEAEEGP